MKIGVVSFYYENRHNNDQYILDIVNNLNDCDLLLFPGYSSLCNGFLNDLIENNSNENTVLITEIAGKWYFIKHDNILNDLPLKQKIEDSKDANNKTTILRFFDELEENRTLIIDNKVIRLLICGEIYITVRHGSEIHFRHPDIIERFNEVCAGTNIFLNPAHRPIPRLFYLSKRCEFLSRENRVCIYCNNIPSMKLYFDENQYVYSDGSSYCNTIDSQEHENYLLNKYEI